MFRQAAIVAAVLASTSFLAGCDSAVRQDKALTEIRQELSAHNLSRAAELATDFSSRYPDNAEAYYLRAQAEALLGNGGSAVRALETAVAKGLANPSEALDHVAFARLNGDPAFVALRSRVIFNEVNAALDGGASATTDPTPQQSDKAAPEQLVAGDVSISRDASGRERIVAGDVSLDLGE